MYYYMAVLGGDFIPVTRESAEFPIRNSPSNWIVIESPEPLQFHQSRPNGNNWRVYYFPPRPQLQNGRGLNLWLQWCERLNILPGATLSAPSVIPKVEDGEPPKTLRTSSKAKSTFKQFIQKTMNTG